MLNTILRKEKAPAQTGAKNKRGMNSRYRPFPPFGKQFARMRQDGEIPARMIMVVFDWKLGRKLPRIVIPDDTPYEGLNFDYLAGLPVEIAYRAQDAHKVNVVSQDILAVKPSFLSTLGLDLLDTNEARTLLKPCVEMEAV
jgi:hypothetical protein